MNSLIGKIWGELARLYFFVEARLPQRYLFAYQQSRLFGVVSYSDVLSFIHSKCRVNRYLEIGVDSGISLSLSRAKINYAIDPGFAIRAPLEGNFSILRTTSDSFFVSYSGGKFDFVFIDGLHEANQVSRDLFNSLANLAPNGLIALHDTVPFNRVVASPRRYTSIWTGDVYRGLTPYIQQCQSHVLTLLVPPTGLTLIKSPKEFLAGLDSPLTPSRLAYEECMRIVLGTAQEVNDIATLERLLGSFRSAGEVPS